MQPKCTFEETGFRFDVLGVGKAALNRANSLTGFLLVKSYTFRAELGVNEIGVVTLGDGFVGAFGFTSAAVDAVGRNIGCHG
jgi:dihydroorotate dehydrogenase